MPSARNIPEETRAFACLSFLEQTVRDQLPDKDDPSSDYAVMAESLDMLRSDLRYLATRAGAAWTAEFGAVLRRSDSMREVKIATGEKDSAQQRTERCDACGRNEKWCGRAIDLGGGTLDAAEWLSCDLDALEGRWDKFANGYIARLKSKVRKGKLQPGDLGRFYVGHTCLRKAKLYFGIVSMIPEIMWQCWTAVQDLSEEDVASSELYTTSEEAATELLECKEQLELCVADERRQDTPDVIIDEEYWLKVDEARTNAGEAELQRVSRASLNGRWTEEVEDQEQEDDLPVEEEDNDEAGEYPDDGPRDAVRPVVPQNTRKRKSRHARVIVSDDEDAGAGADAAVGEQSGADSYAADGAVARPPTRRHARRLSEDAVDDEPIVAEEEDEGSGHDDLVDTAAARPPVRSRSSRSAILRAPSSTAIRMATAMRIPRADGTPASLGSRRSVLADAVSLSQSLLAEGCDDRAARMNRICITLHELIEVAERARGTRNST